ncbi:MAG: PspC domain-containing protein [Pseudomonadota bacterium]
MFRLYRSRDDAVIFGICGGIGETLGVDANLIRVAFAVLALASGVGVAIYVLLALLIPTEDMSGASPREVLLGNLSNLLENLPARRKSLGIVLVAVGAVVLLGNLGLLEWLTFGRALALALILSGLALVWRRDP